MQNRLQTSNIKRLSASGQYYVKKQTSKLNIMFALANDKDNERRIKMADNRYIYEILNHVSSLLDIKQRMPPVPGGEFNIFSILNMESDEVNTHSRLIYEFLNKDGSHGMGDIFLCEFFEKVLEKPYPDSEVSVEREERIDHPDNSGRVDIIISGKDFCYPIEVKIYARDQYKQIERYDTFAKQQPKVDHQVYYLTLDGHEPSEDSLGSVKKEQVEYISFNYHIRKWLERCSEIAWKAPNITEIIRQYINLLDKLTGNLEEDVFMAEIKNIVGRSKENYESALAIVQILPTLRKEMMIRFFSEIEEHMNGKLEKLCTDSDYDKKAEGYYNDRKKNYPSVSYRIKALNGTGITIALRFEVEEKFYYGINFYNEKNEQLNCCEIDSNLIVNAFECDEWKKIISCRPQGKWNPWLWWRYLPSEYKSEKETSDEIDINFWESNGLYNDLFDPEKHKALMKKIFDKIDDQLDSILKTGMPIK